MRQLSSFRSMADCSPSVTRVYRNEADRRRALTQLRRRYNYFVPYLDVQGVALAYGCCNWKPVGEYVAPR